MRRRRADKRKINPDPKYKNLMISKFINALMQCGKKSTAERILYQALDIASQKLEQTDAVVILDKAISNVRPLLQLKSRRVGGATYQIPIEITESKGTGMAMRWIREAARTRRGANMQECLADEISEAFNGQGSARKKRDEIHKMAEANRAFSHYRW